MSLPSLADVREILRQLVAFPTVSADSNLDLIVWVEHFLDARGIAHWRVHEGPQKTSLLACVGPRVPGGIVLSGHTDVVPVREQPWTSDPFALVEREGRWYGRGTADMKTFVALALAYADHFHRAGLTRPVWFAFTHDEEIGCLSAAPMAAALQQADAQPALIVVGEPTQMELVGAHKGIVSFETIITGREAHSSMPEQGVNAVMLMGELIHCLNGIAAAHQQQKDPLSGFPSPYTTVHVGTMEGGTARNIIPRYARICWEVRPLPGVQVEAVLAPYYARVAELQAQMQRIDPASGILTRQLTQVHGLSMQMEEAAHVHLACHLAQANGMHPVSYGTEGGILQHHGFPVVVCGPGSIDQAHQPDEFIEEAQVLRGMAFMQRVAQVLA